jgi:hypothetical protein
MVTQFEQLRALRQAALDEREASVKAQAQQKVDAGALFASAIGRLRQRIERHTGIGSEQKVHIRGDQSSAKLEVILYADYRAGQIFNPIARATFELRIASDGAAIAAFDGRELSVDDDAFLSALGAQFSSSARSGETISPQSVRIDV